MISGQKSTKAWAVVMPVESGATLGPLRLVPELEITETEDSLWLRSHTSDATLEALLAALPASQRFVWMDGNLLRPRGSRFATAQLPDTGWLPLSKWFSVTLPRTALPAGPSHHSKLTLIPSNVPKEINAIVTTVPLWAAWAVNAPAVRLTPLRFAASVTGRVIVVGTPSPSLSGRPMTEIDGVIVPAGMTWSPVVSPLTVRQAIGAGKDELILWDEAGVQLLSEELFVPASRSAARATLAELAASQP